jgi:hypothetical protein
MQRCAFDLLPQTRIPAFAKVFDLGEFRHGAKECSRAALANEAEWSASSVCGQVTTP